MCRPLRLLPLLVLAIIACAAGCSKQPEQAAQPPAPQASPEEVKALMSDHFTKVREIEEAIIRGDLDAAKTPARWIADHQPISGLPAGTEKHVKEMKASAAAVASTDDIGNAAIVSASLVGQCGSCHAASKVSPKLPPVSTDVSGTARKRQMMEHQHAIDRMYRGLISPSSDEWLAGAQALKAAPLGGRALKDEPKEAAAAEARVHELAENATTAAEQRSRVTIYGSLIGACANCHGLHGRVWGPGVSKTN